MVQRQTYDLSSVDKALFNHVRDVVQFAHAQRVAEDRQGNQMLEVETDDPGTFEYIDTFVREVQRTHRKLRRKVLWETPGDGLIRDDIDEQLLASGQVYALSRGLAGIRGDVLTLFRFFESEFLLLSRSLDADENHYPVMLPLDLLEELDYFSHFPQQVTFCSHFPEDLAFFEALARAVQEEGGQLPAEFLARVAASTHVLKPAVCLPCYGQQRHRVLAEGEGFAVTMQNHVFRYEGDNFRSLSRLWDFSVRDVVFFGHYEALVAQRLDVMQRSVALCRELGLSARVQLANDPFFLDSNRNKRVYQRMGEVKYELVLDLPARAEELAVSSFNLHRDFYTRIYDIRCAGGAYAETACMGFGIDRWVYGFLAQKGMDPRQWPARVRAYAHAA